MTDSNDRGTTGTAPAPGSDNDLLVPWRREYEIGHRRLDEQHRRLVDICNEFDLAVRQGRGRSVMDNLLNDLVGYTQEHFAEEERLLEESGYEGLDHHRALHRQLVRKLERFEWEYREAGRRVTLGMREFLRYWLTSHILRDDRDFMDSGDLAAPDA